MQTLALAALLALNLPTGAGPSGTAVAAVEGIYRNLPRLEFDYRKARYAPELDRLLAREAVDAGGEVGLLDAVPFCDCQDTLNDFAFHTSSVAVAPNRAVVTVHLQNGGASTYRIDMVRLPAGWAVADVHGPVHASLVAWLRSALARRNP